ncbi:MAG: glycosyltransferase family 2 protein [Clostridia bacterium]|nr:glycosyltransferase family 2 protein [Clostridia bacterium]
MNQGKISVVIPVYNEEKNIINCIKSLHSYMSESFSDYEIIFVNDGSTDATEQIFLTNAGNYRNLKMISYTPNKGKGNAVRTGMLGITGEYVVCTDCDLAYGVEVIGEMAKGLDSYDLVIGSRNLTKDGHKGYDPIRKLASKTYIKLLNLAAGFKHTDSQCGIKAYRADAAKRIFSNCKTNGFAFDLEVLMIAEKAGLSIGEYPVSIINHSKDDSKVHVFRDTKKMLSDLKRIKKHVKALDEIKDLTKED